MDRLANWSKKANGLLNEIDKTIKDFDMLLQASNKENRPASRIRSKSNTKCIKRRKNINPLTIRTKAYI